MIHEIIIILFEINLSLSDRYKSECPAYWLTAAWHVSLVKVFTSSQSVDNNLDIHHWVEQFDCNYMTGHNESGYYLYQLQANDTVND